MKTQTLFSPSGQKSSATNLNQYGEGHLIEKLKKRSSHETDYFVRSFTQHLYNMGRGLGFSDEFVKDLCSSTWLSFFETLERFHGRSKLKTYLFGIFYNKVYELKRLKVKLGKLDPIEETMEGDFLSDGHWKTSAPDPFDHLNSKQISDLVDQGLKTLPKSQANVFYMKMVLGLDSQEICHILNISDTNLRQLLFRGKCRLRKYLAKHF